MNPRHRFTLPAAMVLVILALGLASPLRDDFTLDWYTVDGGGDMWTTGGDFELSGTVGQPDASTTVLTGGDYELAGGFWTPFAGRVQPVPPSALEADDVLEQAQPAPSP
jgi:hypothetical protein